MCDPDQKMHRFAMGKRVCHCGAVDVPFFTAQEVWTSKKRLNLKRQNQWSPESEEVARQAADSIEFDRPVDDLPMRLPAPDEDPGTRREAYLALSDRGGGGAGEREVAQGLGLRGVDLVETLYR